MKKSYLMIAAAATIFAACQETDTFREINNQQEDNAISFTTFTSKQTRAENSDALYKWSFFNNHTDFQVWGYKDIAPDNAVFYGTKISVGGTEAATTYSYDTLRFWDKTAENYHFYAAAPATPAGDTPAWKWTFVKTGITSASTLNAGYFKTTSELTGVNLKNQTEVGPGANLSDYFKGQVDIDKMIAAPCDFGKSRYAKANPDAVQLNFNHILSKLNITVRKGANISDDLYVVKLTGFEVKNMQGKGDFSEETAAVATNPGTNTRWTITKYPNAKVDYVALTNVTALKNAQNENKPELAVTNSDIYIVESLVIPQDIAFKRVALDGKAKDKVDPANAILFEDYAEYCAAKPTETILTEDEFNTMKAAAVSDPNNPLYADIVKVPEVQAEAAIDAVTVDNNHPYFVISYTINGQAYKAYYNLAAAFGATLETDDASTTTVDESKIAFNEGWQNTLHIVINPDAIEFTADVAEWSTNKNETVYVTEEEQNTQNP